jgi:hypothetical protein
MRCGLWVRWSAVASIVMAGTGCGDGSPAAGGDAGADVVTVFDGTVPARAAGTRAPRTARCDTTDTVRCLLPWPSSAFLVRDAATPTGVRVQVELSTLAMGDLATGVNRADGFSRSTPVITAFNAAVDPASLGDGVTAAMRLVVATPGEHFGEVVPLRMYAVAPEYVDETPGAIAGYPRVLLRPGTDYVVAVLDSVRSGDTRPITRDDHAAAVLGQRPPRDLAEAEAFAYHAPSRDALRAAGVDLARVIRLWDFTTRSADDPRHLLRSMRTQMIAALAAGTARVEITDVTVRETGFVAAVVRGAIRGLPRFTTSDNLIARDAQGGAVPVAGQSFEAPFRIAVPRGMGDYRVVLYGHGTGGNVDDASFDEPISEAGAAKVGIRFDSLTEPELLGTLAGLTTLQRGVEGVSSRLAQSAAGASAILHAVIGLDASDRPLPAAANLREMLAQPMLGSMANPAAGRRPLADRLAWTGGSLGGTMGLTISSVEPRFDGAVLNVPGAAWTHYLTFASLYRAVRPGPRAQLHRRRGRLPGRGHDAKPLGRGRRRRLGRRAGTGPRVSPAAVHGRPRAAQCGHRVCRRGLRCGAARRGAQPRRRRHGRRGPADAHDPHAVPRAARGDGHVRRARLRQRPQPRGPRRARADRDLPSQRLGRHAADHAADALPRQHPDGELRLLRSAVATASPNGAR